MSILVIGGCGFIGSHVVDMLVSKGQRVTVLDKFPEKYRGEMEGVNYIYGDYSSIPVLFEALAGVNSVVHLASATVPATADLDPVGDITNNLISTVKMLEVIRKKPVNKFIYLSSGGTVYGKTNISEVQETQPLEPINSYGIVKVAIEHYLRMEQRTGTFHPVIIRASNPYGPRQGHTGVQGIIGTYLWKIKNNEAIEVWGDGSVIRDYIHVHDLAALCCNAVFSTKTGSYNAGSGVGNSVNNIVNAIRGIVREPLEVTYKEGRAFDVPKTVLNINQAKEAFNWKPGFDLVSGIRQPGAG